MSECAIQTEEIKASSPVHKHESVEFAVQTEDATLL